MADVGHQETEKLLKELEHRIAGEYKIAVQDMQKKLRDYQEQTEAQRLVQKELFSKGAITQKEYTDWCYRHMMMGKRWEQMLDVLVKDMHHTNEIALKMAKDAMPDVYALNANYATYDIEHQARIDTGFVLYNHDTAEYLLGDQRQLMPGPSTRKAREIAANKDMQWNKQKIQSAVFQGVVQGESPYEVAKRLQHVGQMNYNSAVRYARTMTTSAQNAGRYEAFRRADKLGVDLTIEWSATLDMRTRHEHRLMDGQRRDVDEPFVTPDGYTIMYPADCTGTSSAPQHEIWNCFVGETEIASDSDIVRSYKHEYKGELVRIITASGLDFTCTPNHPILTPLGWIAATELSEGDDILVTGVGNKSVFVGNTDINHVHTSIKALHDSLVCLWNNERIPMTNFNFHGDIPTADVEVVSKKRLLSDNVQASELQKQSKVGFINTDTLVLRKGHLVASLRRVYISALRLMRCICKPLALFGRSLSHANIHRLRSVSNGDAGITEYPIDDLPTTTVIRSKLLNGLTGKVFTDNIISVNKSSGFAGHVYNLQTDNGYYLVGNSITQSEKKYNGNYAIVKNCRCTLLSWVKGFEGETVRESPKMEGMSYEEWRGEIERTRAEVSSPSLESRNPVGKPTAVIGGGKLNKRQARLLSSLQKEGDHIIIKKKDVNMRDLAALSAHEQVEFAMLTNKNERMVYRGIYKKVPALNDESAQELASSGWKLSGHTHVVGGLVPSNGDMLILNYFKQERSSLYDPVGRYLVFYRKDLPI